MTRTVLATLLLLAGCGGSDATGTPATTSIAEVQGDGGRSPLEGQVVTITGIVTGDFQDNDADTRNNLGGFYLHSENPDADPSSSEGVFVFDGKNPATDVETGDRVAVSGIVKEHFGETQIAASSVRITGAGSVQAVDVELPVMTLMRNSDGEEIADLERYEGMLVRFPQRLFVSNLRFLERFGEVGLAAGGRPQQFTNANRADAAGFALHKRDIAARSIVLDDGRREMSPKVIRHLTAGASADYSLRAGDTISGVTGNLRYSRGSGPDGTETWRLMPGSDTLFTDSNPRPGAPAPAGNFRVASFNVLNFFSNIDTGRPTCGPLGRDNCRGADSREELARQLEKTVTALAMLDADVIGLVELENDASASVSTLVDALNARLSSSAYRYLDTGSIHDDAIKTAFIYRQATAKPVGDFEILDNEVDARFNDERNRPALAQTFEARGNGARLTIALNHLKSKGSNCNAEGDPNRDDGQGNCNLTRSNAAAALADWMATDPTGSGDPDFLIIGDLNAYLHEDPIQALQAAGLTNLLSAGRNSYSFLFSAQIGALDHAAASPALAQQVAGITEWHINADEPPLLDYNLENGRDPVLFDGTTPYRASDHDPVIVDFTLTN